MHDPDAPDSDESPHRLTRRGFLTQAGMAGVQLGNEDTSASHTFQTLTTTMRW